MSSNHLISDAMVWGVCEAVDLENVTTRSYFCKEKLFCVNNSQIPFRLETWESLTTTCPLKWNVWWQCGWHAYVSVDGVDPWG